MKIAWRHIKFVVLILLAVGLFAFASNRNANRLISKPKVEFLGDNNLFITADAVSNLLIQKFGNVKNVTKETLVLNDLEHALKSNPMIKSAEVYVAVNGALTARVEQKTPLARVNTNASYYVDADGLHMPLSANYSARVPLVTGYVEKNNLKNIHVVAKKVDEDSFLKKHVVEIKQDVNGVLYLKLRQCGFLVQLGNVNLLDKKINNLKAFYVKNLKDKTLDHYSKVNLQFDNQVVCTKI
ncbi:MAG: cell division protein FtsQ/DivIB [Flavobacteriaceae bacterium]